jgi:hypothetical protein
MAGGALAAGAEEGVALEEAGEAAGATGAGTDIYLSVSDCPALGLSPVVWLKHYFRSNS